MDIREAQKDMRDAYLGGGSGVLISGIVWMAAGILAVYSSKQISIIVFFLGGMLIHPIGILVSKLYNRRGKHIKKNPLGKLAMESTVILFMGLFLVYSLFETLPNWFFPIMLMIIGSRYLTFQTIYGLKIYWILGLILIVSGMICLISNQLLHISGITGGIIELIFSVLIIQSDRNNYNLKKEHEA